MMNENPYKDILGGNSDSDIKPDAAMSAEPAATEEFSREAEVSEYSFDFSAHSEEQESSAAVPYDDDAELDTEPVYETAHPVEEAVAQAEPCSYEWNQGEAVPAVSEVPADTQQTAEKNKPRATAKSSVAALLIICILLSAVFGGGSAFLVNHFADKNRNNTNGGITINQVAPEYSLGEDGEEYYLSTVDIVELAADSVVEIITEYVKTGVFAQQYIESGAGSGVIIDSTGYIVTNHHVIEDAQKITVTLRTGESLDATIVGSDSQKDVALLKVDTEEELPAVVFGDSDTLRVGERTVAIGNPLGQLGGTVTEGIISALDRDVVVDGQTMNLMQTDTAINPGNSGGGLFDAQGNLIGIVVAKSSGSEVEGLGFAIPINDAVDVISDLMEYGYVRGRVDVGMEFIDVNSIQTAWMYGLSELGCYVYSVESGSNAETVGFKSGDRIITVDGKDISTSDDIESALRDKAVGDEVVFTISRGGATGEVTLTLEEDIPAVADTPEEDDGYIRWNNYSN